MRRRGEESDGKKSGIFTFLLGLIDVVADLIVEVFT